LPDNSSSLAMRPSDGPARRPRRLYAAIAAQIAGLVRELELEPGDKLPAEAYLARRFGVSRPTVREALVALEIAGVVDIRINVGAILLDPNARLMPAPGSIYSYAGGMDLVDLGKVDTDEVTRLRILLESDGARQSIEQGGVTWEGDLVAAHHRLAHIELRMRAGEPVHFDSWRQADWEFHQALLSACGSKLHRSLHKAAFDQYRKIVQVEYRTIGFRGDQIIAEHKAILDAALARDAAACATALENHILAFFRQTAAASVGPRRTAVTS
jgi:DNA-binding FadR family transcriptional regulator